jgi:PPM family protein phosphatase
VARVGLQTTLWLLDDAADTCTCEDSDRDTMTRLRVAAATDVGRLRRVNEDAFALRADRGLFIVCDGMGGAAAGEVASRLAVDTIVGRLTDERDGPSSAIDSRGYRTQTHRLVEAIRRSNAAIYDQAQRDARQAGMGTTVVSAWIDQDIASLAHVGDSRAYLWRGHRLELLTQDHSLVEEYVRAGLMTRDQGTQSAQQHVLVRALGREPVVDADVTEVPLQVGDILLLCSDGLTRMVSEDAMARTLARCRDPRRICDALVAAANHGGGEDNITVVVVNVVGRWHQRAFVQLTTLIRERIRWRN